MGLLHTRRDARHARAHDLPNVGSSDVRVQDARGVVDQARDRGSRGV